MIGKLLGGRYQVIKNLGTGGFGQTYAAEDTHRPGSPKCVVKHLKPASSNSSFLQSARRLFQSEAETLEKLGSHDQIPRLLAYFEEDKEFYLVQEFIQGHPLTARLLPGERWSESQVRQLLLEVLGILEFVHSNGVIHRDIKPNNIIQRHQDNRIVLVDFGSVKQTWKQVVTAQGQTSTTFSDTISATIGIGTPGYMPTEQGRGRPRPNSDIYALGIIAIQALTGLNPMQFEEDADTGEIIWQHQAHLSDELASVITKMVCYHFKDRFQTTAEVLEALKSIDHHTYAPALLDTKVDVSVQQVNPPQITVFLPQFSQEPLPDPNVISVAATNRLDTLPKQAAHAAIPALPLPITDTVSVPQSPVSQIEEHKPVVNGKEPEVTASASNVKSPPYPASATNYNQLRLGAGITAILISLVAGYSLYWQPRPSISKTLEQIASLKAAGKYKECVSQAPTVPQHSFFYTDAQALLHECQLAQSKAFAAERQFAAAITEANKIPQSAAFYQDAQQLIAQWSDNILQIATNTYKSGKLQEAIAIASAIPQTSPVYTQTQGAVKQWQQEWQQNNSYLQAAQKALAQGQWQNAITAANKVVDTPYWQQQIEPITQKAEAKIATSKPAVTSQPRRASTAAVTRTPSRTTPRRVTRTAIRRTPVRTTPRRVTRTATRTPVRTTPRRVTRTATRTPVRTTPRRATRTATRRATRTTPRRVTRATTPRRAPRRATRTTPRRVTRAATRAPRRTTPRKPSYTWTTKTVP